jgi:Ca2+-binding RTX toxin-like protein
MRSTIWRTGCLAAVLILFSGFLEGPAAAGGGCTVTGTQGNDTLSGTPGPDAICGLGGRDTIHASGGDDLLRGGSGDDRLFGGSGADRLTAGQGDDRLIPGAGNDVSFGGPGNDTSNRTSAGEDRWHGGTGNDRLTDFRGRDRIFGEAGSDRCLATEDGFVGDWVFGGPGTDTGEADPCDRMSGVEVRHACASSMPRRMARHGERTFAASGWRAPRRARDQRRLQPTNHGIERALSVCSPGIRTFAPG